MGAPRLARPTWRLKSRFAEPTEKMANRVNRNKHVADLGKEGSAAPLELERPEPSVPSSLFGP